MKQSKIILAAVTLFCVGLLTAAVVVLFGKVGFFHSDTDRPTTVSIGGQPYPAQLSAFTVTNSDFDYSQLAQFHSLQSVDVTAVEIDADEYQRICSQVGEQVSVLWDIPFNGTRLPSSTSELRLSSAISAADQSLLAYFDNLTDVTITDDAPFDQLYPIMRVIRDSHPDVRFQCSTSLYGVPLDSTTESLVLSNIKLSDTDQLCRAIEFFPNLKTIEMCRCGLSNDVMGQLRETYPDIQFIWLIHVWKDYVRTDAQVFSTLSDLSSNRGDSDTFSPLFRYCTELRALDLGHMKITDISEIRNLKKLQILILGDNSISDISPLADLKKLNYLEIFENKIEDLSPLVELPHLEDLNICYNPNIQNPTVLTNCKSLKRLYCSHCNISKNDIATLAQGVPGDCEFNSTSYNCVFGGWRTNAKNAKVRKAFQNWESVKEYPSWDTVVYQ